MLSALFPLSMRPRTWRRGLAGCILLLAIGTSGAQAQEADAHDCRDAKTTVAITECYHQQYEQADSVRSAVYNTILSRFKAEEAEAEGEFKKIISKQIKTLRAARQAWIDYREAHCEAVYAKYGNGTMRGIAAAWCRLNMTERRIQELRETYQKKR